MNVSFFRSLTLFLLAGFVAYLGGGCRTKFDTAVVIPQNLKAGLDLPGAKLLFAQTRKACEGVYAVSDGSDVFGAEIAAKWSYTVKNKVDTTYHFSLFCEPQATYFVLEGRQVADSIIFLGYWRRLVNADVGTARFVVRRNGGARVLLAPDCCQALKPGDVVFKGMYGNGEENQKYPLTLSFNRPLNPKPFQIIAHRSGGRTSDLLPASENSVEIIRLAPELGATGVEFDIRQTKDGVPILYHDDQLNLRLTQKSGLIGPVENYTYKQLTSLVRLVNGEQIPTLEEALTAVIDDTPLQTVWMDSKLIRDMPLIREIHKKYIAKAAAQGRKVNIYIGLPTETTLNQFEALDDHLSAPSLCELDTSIARRINAKVWAPRFTLGNPVESAKVMQAAGLKVFVWTLDVPDFVRQFIDGGALDGILTNYSAIVAYYHYVQKP
ncbi:glycerophosphodiester phosphodiesterase [Fibrella sp. HMF5335]|uniref:Glycerophosphodiester phosphodiesterase n=1 Tax=Fibrella rubiginis TaxID=2817060 RepID=A0A939K040_9BACT|nr:glycerophosphodiester phosphodiesterase family protein [Fibrella rubiginis]MBO0935692.1 glycerophosphodiester phosphodiesterase [Fibrella rubiginis]